MSIRLYNTATRKKEEFIPLEDKKVGIYVCGVTVYDLCHIGHARSAIVFDVLVRYLRARGFDVTYVRNFTDVDDKIILRANELGKEISTLAQEYIDAFQEDMARLKVNPADEEPRATGHIQGMIQMIQSLLDRGYAYREGNDIFFSVECFPGYGVLSGRRLEDMQAGTRIAVDDKKRHPMDFVLWKAAKPDEPQWQSPWGPGRPGWHLECSVMSNYFLGPTFDIHGGGKDLLFPHHENERAQSIGANGGGFARYWVHNGFVTVESEKMSKSLGNFLTIRDVLKENHPEVLRLFLLSKHYRSPIDFSKSAVQAMQAGLVRIYRTLERINEILGFSGESETKEMPEAFLADPAGDSFLDQFIQVMDDDLNTAGGIGLIFDKVRNINKLLDESQGKLDTKTRNGLFRDRRDLLLIGRVMGILSETPEQLFEGLSHIAGETAIDTEMVEEMVRQRTLARKGKNWAEADRIRDRLKEMGILLEDGPQGTSWRMDV